jgi:Na+/proline symporter
MLVTFVILYLLASIAVGLWVARRVKNTEDYAVAGRSLFSAMLATENYGQHFPCVLLFS